MTDRRDALLALAERVEGLAGPCRKTCCSLENILGLARFEMDAPSPVGGGWLDRRVEPRPYTASLDAAMTLVPDEAFWRVGHDGEGPDPSLFRAQALLPERGVNIACVGLTSAIALTAAALRAHAAMEGE